MFRTSRIAGGSLCVLLTLALAPAAHAVPTLQDVYDAVQTSINRATAARDRAIEARDNSLETVGHVRDGFNELTGDMNDAITDALDDFKRVLAEQKAGRDAFLAGGEPAAFRAQLVGLTSDLETLLNSPFGLAGLSATPVDMQKSIDIINNLPDRALYPLYLAMTSQGDLFNQEFLDKIQDLVADLPALAAAVQEMKTFDQAASATATTDLLDEKNAACANTIAHRQEWRAAATEATLVGIELRTFGIIFKALGETGFNPDAGVHGYFHVTIKDSPLKKYGIFLDGVGTVFMSVGSAVSKHVSDAENVRMMADLRNDISSNAVPTSGSIAMGALMLLLLSAGAWISRRRQAAGEVVADRS